MPLLDWLLVLGQLPWFGWVELTVNSLLRLLEVTLVWPVAIFAVAFMFRRALRDLIDSLVRIKFHDTEIELLRNRRNVRASRDALSRTADSDPTADADAKPTAQGDPAPEPAAQGPEDVTTEFKRLVTNKRQQALKRRLDALTWLSTSDAPRAQRWRDTRAEAQDLAILDPANAADMAFFTFMAHTFEATLPPRRPEEGRVWPDALTEHYPASWMTSVRNLRSILQEQRLRMTTEQALEIIAQLDELLIQHVVITGEDRRKDPLKAKDQGGS